MPTRARPGGSWKCHGEIPCFPLDDSELDAFYRKIFMPLVRRATWKHGLLREDARDIVQDAFVLALTRLEKSGNPKAWLIQVVDHLAINYRRKVLRRANLTERWCGRAETGATGRSDADSDSDV